MALFLQTAASAQIDIVERQGNVEVYLPRAQTWSRVTEVPWRVEKGDKIRTGGGSTASLLTPDGSKILLGASSEFEAESSAGVGELALFKLDIGTLKAWVTKSLNRRFRVRLEEYVVRPAADQFKLVALSERASRFDYFYYQARFNQNLPTDLTEATRYLSGKTGAAPDFFITEFETGRSNTRDSVIETGIGGHLVNAPLTADTVVYDGHTNTFTTAATGTAFWSTLFDNYSYKINYTLQSHLIGFSYAY